MPHSTVLQLSAGAPQHILPSEAGIGEPFNLCQPVPPLPKPPARPPQSQHQSLHYLLGPDPAPTGLPASLQLSLWLPKSSVAASPQPACPPAPRPLPVSSMGQWGHTGSEYVSDSEGC